MYVLSKISGECPQLKILEAFAQDPDKMLYLTKIEELTSISKITIADHLNKLLKEDIIQMKGKEGRKQYYQLNKENPIAKIILSLEKHIETEHLDELIKKDKGEATLRPNVGGRGEGTAVLRINQTQSSSYFPEITTTENNPEQRNNDKTDNQ